MSIQQKCSAEGCDRLGKLHKNGNNYTIRGLCEYHYVKKYRLENQLYQTWSSMIQRCENPNHIQYKDYGGRGITICDRWRRDYKSFESDMGGRPLGFTLDRIDNDGNYEPNNCRWASRVQQMHNKGLPKNNTSGYKGVRYNKKLRKWQASMMYNRKFINAGFYENLSEAVKARKELEMRYQL